MVENVTYVSPTQNSFSYVRCHLQFLEFFRFFNSYIPRAVREDVRPLELRRKELVEPTTPNLDGDVSLLAP